MWEEIKNVLASAWRSPSRSVWHFKRCSMGAYQCCWHLCVISDDVNHRQRKRERQTDRQAGLSHTGRTEDEPAYNAVCSQCFISQSLLSCIGQAVGVRGSDRPVCFQTDYQTICFLTSYQTFWLIANQQHWMCYREILRVQLILLVIHFVMLLSGHLKLCFTTFVCIILADSLPGLHHKRGFNSSDLTI